mmetsp:Transcript_99523/g.195516  ORF Transcript_99523/g.195516 Transcript_99523/m.195516 type:complete len:209 (-) Transcript_99523:17-643(-)
MHEEFVAMLGQVPERFLADLQIGPFLPPVRDDLVFRPRAIFAATCNPAATQVEDQLLAPDGGHQGGQALPVQRATMEDMRGDDDMAGTGIEVFAGVFRGDSTADLQAAGVRPQRFQSSGAALGRGSQQDHMAAGKAVVSVPLGEVARWLGRGEVGDWPLAFVFQGAADDLLHLALVDVDARPEAHRDGDATARPKRRGAQRSCGGPLG